MSKAVSAIICVTGVAVFLIWMVRSDRGEEREVELAHVEVPDESLQQESSVSDLGAADSLASRTEAPKSVAVDDAAELIAAEEAQPDVPVATWIARGIVLDPSGAPMVGMKIVRLGGDGSIAAETGGDGRFEVQMKGSQAAFAARGEGYRTVFAGAVNQHLADEDAVIMVARVVRMSGTVVTESGAPVGGAAIAMDIPWKGVVGFPRSLERSSRVGLEWSSDKDGAFDLEDVPVVTGVPLSTVADGFVSVATDVPTSDMYGLLIELPAAAVPGESNEPEEFLFSGVVHDSRGRPIEGAKVFFDDFRTESDGAGRWEFARGRRVRSGTPLAAVHESGGTGMLPFDESWNGSRQSYGPFTIALQSNDLAIAGHVVDSDGQALVGWTVQLLDPTNLSLNEIPAPTLERGGTTKSVGTVSDEEGHFRIEGLLDRNYEIRAYGQPSFLSMIEPSVPAGTSDLELRLTADATIAEMRIRVTTRDGLAVANATVQTRFMLQMSSSGFVSDNGTTGITDAEGFVTLSQVPRRGVDIVASKPGIVTGYLSPGETGFPEEEAEIQVDRNLQIIVDCSRMDPVPESVRIFDEHGERLMISARTANGSTSSTDLALDGGISPVVTVSEAAREVVIVRDWKDADRVPIQLTPGTITRIELP